MSERARTLAHELEQANQALIATIEGLSDAQWQAKTPGDGRSVGVVAHPPVRTSLETTHLAPLLEIAASREDALRAIGVA